MEQELISFEFYKTVVDSLMLMFGDLLTREVVESIVESCGGDMNSSADAIMNITNDSNSANISNSPKTPNIIDEKPLPLTGTTIQTKASCSSQPSSTSYAASAQSTGALPKQQLKSTHSNMTMWSDQFRRIISYHNQGYRVLILMRGVPGSGKSYLATRIIEVTIGPTIADLKTHICSTDDYFTVGGRYIFNRHDLPYAHSVNQRRSKAAMEQGLSPVIIDNTNIEIWETEPYVKAGVANGYIIEVMEPNTPWAKKPNQLCRRNVHNVPITSIKRMLDNYVNNITGDSLIKSFGLSYPADKVPPVIRSMPVYHAIQVNDFPSNGQQPELQGSSDCKHSLNDSQTVTQTATPAIDNGIAPTTIVPNDSTDASDQVTFVSDQVLPAGQNDIHNVGNKNNSKDNGDNSYKDLQKQIEEIEKLELEWERGEKWAEQEVSPDSSKIAKNIETATPKPQRIKQSKIISKEKVLKNFVATEDWNQISMFMPPWEDKRETSSSSANPNNKTVNTISIGTSTDIADYENSFNTLKVLNAIPRDINELIFSVYKEKIPEKRMLDKSSMTNEHIITDATKRCQYEEKHFKEFRKLFKYVSKNALRDIFDNCMGDVNWAVEIVLDGMHSKELPVENECVSDEEEETNSSDGHCSCLDAYNVLPDKFSVKLENESDLPEPSTSNFNGTTTRPQGQRKLKKDSDISDKKLNLKHLIEKNIDFAEDHYSEHCLKIRKLRRGVIDTPIEAVNDSNVTDKAIALPDSICHASTSSTNEQRSDDEESNSSFDDSEKTVHINLGKEFITELDFLFGRTNMTYPDNVVTKINIPLSLLNEINALWMESLMHQLDEHDKQTAKMLAEDEELARQLSLKEAELALAGKEPEIPDFKEIMDLDFALSLYEKDVAKWRSKVPDDLAAKLTRDKLYNLFPDVPKDVLIELLIAHHNNFQLTVETLLVSTGKADILEKKNGLNKFVMDKELERQARILAEEKKALSEVEWPPLPPGEPIEMSHVHELRKEAEHLLEYRNRALHKAGEYVQRGMIIVAIYLSKAAALAKIKYEQANSQAVASLVQIHAANCDDASTLDLHYLRVAEAMEALDLFIDSHIKNLRENQAKGVKSRVLYIITGRGLHSHGGPKIKPATKTRLNKRGLTYHEKNPGLLSSKVCWGDRLTDEVRRLNNN